jgi:hypothetical protein
MHPTQAREIVACALGDTSFTRSFDLCASILAMHRGESHGGGAVDSASRLGKPTQVGGTSTGAGLNGRCAARRVSTLPQGRGVARREEEGGHGLRPCEDSGARVWLPARRNVTLQKSVGDVWPRISSANALQKGRSGSSERGPSSERGSAGETVGRHVERRARRESASPVENGAGPAQGPGWREIVTQRFVHRQKRWAGRGTGVVMTTGSYEGYLPMEGIPDHHDASAFTRRRPRWSWRCSASSDPHAKPKAERAARLQLPRRWEEREDEREIATGVSEARSRQHRGKKTPTFMTQAVRPMSMRLVLERRSAEAVFGRRETSGPPVMPYGA